MKTLIVRFLARFSFRQRIVLGGAVAVVLFSLFMIGRSGGAAAGTIEVTRGSISQTVSVTGQFQPVQSVDLSFQSGGRVAYVPVRIGDTVRVGQLLASLNSAELSAQLRDAEAGVLSQQARLDELLEGSRPEDIRIKEIELQRAERDLQSALENAYTTLSDGLAKADNSVRVQLDGMFDEVGTIDDPSYKLEFSCFCDQIDLTVNAQRNDVEDALRAWADEMDGLYDSTSRENVLAAFGRARAFLQSVKVMLQNLSVVINHPTVGLPVDTVTEYRATVNTALTTAIAAQVSVASQEQSILTYALAFDRTAQELDRLRNGSTEQTILAQRALLLSAQAQVDRAKALLAKNYIISPITGIVTVQDAKIGQNVSPNVTVISVMSEQQLEMEANVPEVDIAKVSLGDEIDLTVDALPGETLQAYVRFIDPAETVIDGVVNFRILAELRNPDTRLKSGLTVNMDIITERNDSTLVLPQFAIIENDDGTFVRRPDGSETPVSIGIRSQDGIVEILSGLSEGDSVLNIGLKSTE